MTTIRCPTLVPLSGIALPERYKPTTVSEISVADKPDNTDDSAYDSAHDEERDESGSRGISDTINRYLLGCLINIKYYAKANGTYSIRQKVNGSGSKYFRASASYRRMFFFADMLSKGTVFAIFEQNNNDTELFFRSQQRERLRVGDFVLIQEPEPVKHVMPGSVYKVNTIRPWLLLHRPVLGYTIDAKAPEADKQEFFFLSGVKLLKANGFTPVKATCNGTLCDRQKSIDTMDSEGCGCYCGDTRVPGFVLSTNFEFKVLRQGRPKIRGFRSWRFTLILFRSYPPTSCSLQALDDSIENIRKSGEAIVKHVNENGGWDVMAWYKRGTITDGSARSANANPAEVDQTVSAEKQELHIVYLYPTKTEIIRTNAFKAKQFNPATLDI